MAKRPARKVSLLTLVLLILWGGLSEYIILSSGDPFSSLLWQLLGMAVLFLAAQLAQETRGLLFWILEISLALAIGMVLLGLKGEKQAWMWIALYSVVMFVFLSIRFLQGKEDK